MGPSMGLEIVEDLIALHLLRRAAADEREAQTWALLASSWAQTWAQID